MANTFTLIAEAVQGEVTLTRSLPSAIPTTAHIDMQSTVFPADATLSFRVRIEESFDNGVTWTPASGFPSSAVGGNAGTPKKGGGVNTGLPWWEYAYDGRARQLRTTFTPYAGGTPDSVVVTPNDPLIGLRPGSVPGSYDWGLTVTLQ